MKELGLADTRHVDERMAERAAVGDVVVSLPEWVVGALLDRRPSQLPNNSNAWWTLQRVLREATRLSVARPKEDT